MTKDVLVIFLLGVNGYRHLSCRTKE